MTAPRRDGRSVQQTQSAACLLWRRFGALTWVAAYAGRRFDLLPAPAAMCPDADGSGLTQSAVLTGPAPGAARHSLLPRRPFLGAGGCVPARPPAPPPKEHANATR